MVTAFCSMHARAVTYNSLCRKEMCHMTELLRARSRRRASVLTSDTMCISWEFWGKKSSITTYIVNDIQICHYMGCDTCDEEGQSWRNSLFQIYILHKMVWGQLRCILEIEFEKLKPVTLNHKKEHFTTRNSVLLCVLQAIWKISSFSFTTFPQTIASVFIFPHYLTEHILKRTLINCSDAKLVHKNVSTMPQLFSYIISFVHYNGNNIPHT